MTALEVAAYTALFVVFWGIVLRLIHLYLESLDKKRRIPKGYLGVRGKKTLYACKAHRSFIKGPMILDPQRCGFCIYNVATGIFTPGKGGPR